MFDLRNKNKQLAKRPSTSVSPVGLFSKRARTAILSICAVALVCFVLLPFGLDRIGTANTHAAYALTEPTAGSPTPMPAARIAVVGQEGQEDGESAAPSPSDEIQVSNYSLLQLNDDYPAVESLQLRLMELGYLDSDEPGTKYNEATAAAVAMFQRTLDTPITGIADSELQTKLYSSDAANYEVRLGDDGTDVRAIQKLLHGLGYYDGKINGYFGIATEEALKSFQQRNGLDEDGIYNLDDRDILYSGDARPYHDPTPTPKPTSTPKPAKTPKPTKTPKPAKTASPGKTSAPVEKTPKPTPIDGGLIVDPAVPELTPEPEVVVTPAPTDPPSDGGKEYPTGGDFNASGDVAGVISVAQAQIGKRYVRGDEGPNTFDCSGLIYYCLTKNGVSVGRRSAASYSQNESWTLITSMSDLEKGDLLFFRDDKSSRVSHVGLYIGGGKMIDASSSLGEVVKRSCKTDYWTRNFVCARRVF